MCTGFLIIFINVTYITENDKLFHYNNKRKARQGVVYYQDCKSYASEVDTMGQITIRELGNMDFFREIPKDILQNLLNEVRLFLIRKGSDFSFTQQNKNSVFCVFRRSDAL